jgi:hypothetical protein
MSYGREPWYIFEGPKGIEFMPTGSCRSISVPKDAIAQLVATMAWRDEQPGVQPAHGGLAEYIKRGKELRGWT